MAFAYRFAGRALFSSVPLVGVLPLAEGNLLAGQSIQVSMDLGDLSEAGPVRFRWRGGYDLTLRLLGSDWLFTSGDCNHYLVSAAGDRIRCAGNPGSFEFSDVLVRRILPRIPLLVDATLVHAAAIGDATGGILMAGASGAGKSTLSAALSHRAGWTLLSDDLSVLRYEEGPLLYPAASGVCVWGDSQQALGLPAERCRSMPGYDGKVWFGADVGGRPPVVVPLRAFVSLARSDDCHAPRLQPLSSSDAFIDATRQLILFDPSDHAASRLPEHFARLGRIIESVACYSLIYPSSYRAIQEIDSLLRSLLR
ncbi:hypothetical protein [Solimonas sp. SE-A11]|uniref:hypothetical protein n=1 Tax=Solimonas sp. SE-A11 TaxID=3054954 RepID=UPI00259C79DC|nr:hypothetical protein [Solimonas sp. SE-A11]MDM4772320.1 hypothetical protein [Solimonas sp. SE-A11]